MTESWQPAPPTPDQASGAVPPPPPAPVPAGAPPAPPHAFAPAAPAAPAVAPTPPAVHQPAPTFVAGAAPARGDGPFDPAGIVWQRVSPRLVTVRLISVAVWLGIPFVAGVVVAVASGVPALWAVPAVLGALGGWLTFLVPRQVRAIGYAERDDDLLIRKGIMFRQLVVVPYGRMQFVDVQAGPLDRWGGIAKVQLHTASPSSDAVIPGLPPAEADRLRDRLAERGEARLAGL